MNKELFGLIGGIAGLGLLKNKSSGSQGAIPNIEYAYQGFVKIYFPNVLFKESDGRTRRVFYTEGFDQDVKDAVQLFLDVYPRSTNEELPKNIKKEFQKRFDIYVWSETIEMFKDMKDRWSRHIYTDLDIEIINTYSTKELEYYERPMFGSFPPTNVDIVFSVKAKYSGHDSIHHFENPMRYMLRAIITLAFAKLQRRFEQKCKTGEWKDVFWRWQDSGRITGHPGGLPDKKKDNPVYTGRYPYLFKDELIKMAYSKNPKIPKLRLR